ncbi:MAG: DHH family phosphoesterase [Vulcanimicrobiota bacterium]
MAYKSTVPKEITEAFKAGQSFLLVAHMGLDGDHLGSMLTLARALRQIGKKVRCYLPEVVPEAYEFLPDLELLDKSLSAELPDTLVTLECPDVQRLPHGIDIPAFQAKGIKVINLDHHPDNENYGDVLWIEPEAAALGEMIFDLLIELGVSLDREMALGIYTAILTDTGSFQYSRVTTHTHLRLAEVMKFDLPTDDISRRLFKEARPNVVQLLGSVLSRVTLTGDGRLAYAELPLSELQELQVDDSETRFFIDDIDRVKGPEVVAIFREMSNSRVKVSLRSRRAAINGVAARFGGGGHAKAAGCVVSGSLSAVREQVVSAVIDSLN